MVSSISMSHGPQHGLWWQYRHINMALWCIRNTDPDRNLGGSMDLDITVASGGSTGYSHQYGP